MRVQAEAQQTAAEMELERAVGEELEERVVDAEERCAELRGKLAAAEAEAKAKVGVCRCAGVRGSTRRLSPLPNPNTHTHALLKQGTLLAKLEDTAQRVSHAHEALSSRTTELEAAAAAANREAAVRAAAAAESQSQLEALRAGLGQREAYVKQVRTDERCNEIAFQRCTPLAERWLRGL